jgi:hypothetical protein
MRCRLLLLLLPSCCWQCLRHDTCLCCAWL